MLSDSVILNSVTFKPLFGAKADQSLRATIKVVKAQSTNASNSEIRSSVLAKMDSYFNIGYSIPLIKCRVWEDNQSCMSVSEAKKPPLRMKHIVLK